MDHAAEIIELRKTVDRLEKEIERLDIRKIPVRGWRGHLQSAMFGLVGFSTFMFCVSYFGPAFGLRSFARGQFGSVESERYRIEDQDNSENWGTITTDNFGPDISLRTGREQKVYVDCRRLQLEDHGDSVRVDSNVLRLEGERGTLILELNEKGEPVLRSIPAKKP